MLKVGDFIVYKRYVCKVIEIKEKQYLNKDYYILSPITDESLKISIPVDNSSKLIRKPMSKKEALNLINSIPNISVISDVSDRLLEYEYKELLYSGNNEDLIKIIKTTYIRNDNRIESGKKVSEKDKSYFNKAESILYSELSVSLNMTYDETKKFVQDKVSQLINENN